MSNPEPASYPAATQPASRRGCPRCGRPVQMTNKPWLGLIAVPLIAFGGIVAVFAVGIILAAIVLGSPVSCRACGPLRLKDIRTATRAAVIAKKLFVAILLVLILAAGHASLSAWRSLQPQ